MNQEDALRSDIHDALEPVSGSMPDLMPGIVRRLRPVSRRRPFGAMGQVAAVLGILIVGAIVFSTHRPPVKAPIVSTSPTTPIVAGPGANIAWITSQPASGGLSTGDIVTGVDPSGRVVGRINARDELRSPDGSHLYALTDAGVDVFSAVDGHNEQTIRLASVSLGVPMLSPDGRYLAVVGGSPSTLQLVDLSIGRAVASTPIGSPAYGIPVIVGAHAEHVYVVGPTIARFAFDGATLRAEKRTTGHALACDGLVAGGSNSAGGLSFRVLADGRTLVAFCPMNGAVDWFDLDRMTVAHEVLVPQRNPFWMSPVFAPDSNTLYLYEGGTGELHVVDLVHKTVAKSTKVASAGANPLAWLRSLLITEAYAGAIDRTAAVSPDGVWLYTIRDFSGPAGISLVHLPELGARSRWLPDAYFNSIWVSADGRTIYLLESGDHVRVLRTDGSVVAKLSLPANTFGFIVPTIP